MEFPIIFKWGYLALSAHFLFEVLAFFLGFRYFLWLRRSNGDTLASSSRLTVFLGAAVGALVGSRFLGALEVPQMFLHPQGNWLYYFQSKTIIGALLGGLAGVELAKKMIGEQQSSGGLFTFPLILGIIIGRIGCFSMGVAEPTFGLASDLPWAMDLGDGIRRHPTALYEIFFLGVLWCTLLYIRRKFILRSGALFKLFMVAYLLYRFTVAFIQPVETWWWGLGTLQLACLLGLLYYHKVWLRPRCLLQAQNHEEQGQ